MPISTTTALAEVRVGALLDRYLIGLDEQHDSERGTELDDTWAQSLFTADASVEFPVGRHHGIEGLAAFHHTALAKFTRTQHLNSGTAVDVEGDHATLRANLIATQVLPSGALFTTGSFVRGAARLEAPGWRLTRLSFALVWSTGEPPVRPN